jgi:two-component system, NtrC family, response regulator HydG
MLGLFRRLNQLQLQPMAEWSIFRKLFVFLIPAVIIIIGGTGWILNIFSKDYIEIAIERTTSTLTLAQAHELETLLDGCREDTVSLAHRPITRERLRNFMEASAVARGQIYAEAAFIGVRQEQQYVFLKVGDTIQEVPLDLAQQVKNGPLTVSRKAVALGPGEVTLSDLTDVYYPPTGWGGAHGQLNFTVMRLTTPVADGKGGIAGYLVLSVDGRRLRDLLSLYISTRSPLLGYSRGVENRLSLFVDERGWILFQSENVEDPERDLSVEAAKTGLSGDHGKPSYDDAFRPGPQHEGFWRMVSALQQGGAGVERGEPDFGPTKLASSEDFLGYAPVRFRGDPKEGEHIIGGVIYIDRSLLPRAAEFGQFNILFGTMIGGILTLSLLILLLGRVITRPILRLAEAVGTLRQEGQLHEVDVPESDRETTILKRAVNGLIASLVSKETEIRVRDDRLRTVRAREKVRLAQPAARQGLDVAILEDLVGESAVMERLVERIRKIAASDADVLIIGETGTGKELAAEAIHRLSQRAIMPFISINCGALDENLLMDALFGHVKGAFSEAKTERKGAFLAANGGTLLLDEVGNASARVQQALLRALSVRRISALGSDVETVFDARVVAATNVNLKDRVASGDFREDLYYRLQVLSVTTPPLRERLDDLPILAGHFLKMAARRMGKGELHLSRGALDKLVAHDWPGNVRELKNCLIRAAALTEREIILDEDVHFEDEPGLAEPVRADPPPVGEPLAGVAGVMPLNARQRRALRGLYGRESFNRQDYQEAGGEGVPQRTAQHDLQDLVNRGLVLKEGRGPATRYRMARERVN